MALATETRYQQYPSDLFFLRHHEFISFDNRGSGRLGRFDLVGTGMGTRALSCAWWYLARTAHAARALRHGEQNFTFTCLCIVLVRIRDAQLCLLSGVTHAPLACHNLRDDLLVATG